MRSKAHTARTAPPLVLHCTRIGKYAMKKCRMNGQWRSIAIYWLPGSGSYKNLNEALPSWLRILPCNGQSKTMKGMIKDEIGIYTIHQGIEGFQGSRQAETTKIFGSKTLTQICTIPRYSTAVPCRRECRGGIVDPDL